MAYSVRACILPDIEFSHLNQETIQYCCGRFYDLFYDLFGATNCSYTIHIVCTHLLEIRKLGPLTESSAFGFENFYSELRQSFTPGTNAPLKQMLQNVILKRALSHHVCIKSIHYSAEDTPLECNSIIYSFRNNTHEIFKIKSVHASFVICYKQGKFPFSLPETNLQWNKVGVYRLGSLLSLIHI